MIKNLTGGSVIRYGATLPVPNITQDGTLFFKTSGTDKGLYVYNTVQDTNSALPGNQTAQAWSPAVSSGLQFDDDGALLNVNLRFNDPSLIIFCNNYAQVNRTGNMTVYSDADFQWRKDFRGLNTEMMKLSAAGVLTVAGYTVWHAGNQQQADVGKLNGQPGSYYQNASNINSGTLAVARLPFMPVQQGGGIGQLNNKVNIGFTNIGTLNLQVDSTNFAANWPISVTGNAASATYATSAGSAQNANFAQTAQEAVHATNADNSTNAVTAQRALTADFATLVKLSTEPGNLINQRADGIYYGFSAPADVGTLYIDAVNGLDSNPGTKVSPLKTIREGVDRGPAGVNREMFLMEFQNHYVDPANASIIRGGQWNFLPYGPQSDMLPPRPGDTPFYSVEAQALAPSIVSLPFETVNGYQNATALAANGDALVIFNCINFYCGVPNNSGAPISSINGTFYDGSATANMYLRNCKIVMPDALSNFLPEGKYGNISIILDTIKLSGPGKFDRNPTRSVSLTWRGGQLGANDSTDVDMKSYISGATTTPLSFANFSTNLIPNAAEPYLTRAEVQAMIDASIP